MRGHYSPSNQSRQAASFHGTGSNIQRVTVQHPRSPNKNRNLAPLTQSHTASYMSMRVSPRRDSPPQQMTQASHSQLNGSNSQEVILIEDFDEANDSQFLNEVVKPHFKTIFEDVSMRRHTPKKTEDELEFIDKTAFFEYVLLPGIINDRFFSQFQKTADDHIYEESFIEGMIKVYLSSFEEKMRMTFNMYDFDNDGILQREDVRILLSYVPFKTDQDLGATQSVMSENITVSNKEGLYDNKQQTFQQRKKDQEEIQRLMDHIFGTRTQLQYEEYSSINQKITSEMFTGIMRVLHELLPCSKNFFFLKRKYRAHQLENEDSDGARSDNRKVRQIASPRLVRGLSLGKSPSRKLSSRGASIGSQDGFSQRFSGSVASPDVRVKKKMNPEAIRNSSRQNKALNSQGSFVLPELNDINSMGGMRSPVGSPKKILNMQSKIRNKNAPPLFIDLAGRTSSISELESGQCSPITPSKAFGLRNYKRPNVGGQQHPSSQNPIDAMGSSYTGGFAATMSPSSTFKINLQKNNISQAELAMQRGTHSTLGNNKNGAKLLPMVNTTQGSPVNSRRAAAYESRGGPQNVDRSILAYSPEPRNRGQRNMDNQGAVDEQSAMRSKTPNNQIVLEGFGGFEDADSAEDIVEHQGHCYLKTKAESYKKHWMVLQGNEIRFYRKQGEEEHKVMHCLAGTYLKEISMDDLSEKSSQKASAMAISKHSKVTETATDKGKNYFPIKLVIPPNKSRIVFFSKQEDQVQWIEWLQQAMGYSNMFKFYELNKTLGKGQFGLVKLAVHKQTGKKAAVKQVKKKNMTHIEVFQQRREIEVLKMCQHPNIINLVDLFENSDYYYIVLDFMAGSDLFDYLQAREFNLGESRVCELTYQLALGIKYLHSYGIVHRDLKLENIMMTDTSSTSVPKLVDFGLAKMIGPSERATEPFGTLGYVAPEILEKKPYTFSCDLWSLGCIVYALLCSSLPFDHDSQKETIRMTCEDRVVFDSPQWSSYSQDCQDLINRLLIKKPEERITLEQALAHPWFRKVRAKFERYNTQTTSSPQAKR